VFVISGSVMLPLIFINNIKINNMETKQIKCYCGHTIYCDCDPLEEPKIVTVNVESATGEDLGTVSYIPLPNVDYTPKQETLEEAARDYIKGDDLSTFSQRAFFIAGAKWQQKRMYSEEEVFKLLCSMPNFFNTSISQQTQARKDWFEQFKKKQYDT
jgi:hypothetical protein